jgi:hypothetical protein
MKNLSLTFCLGIAALLASVGGGFASDLTPCPSSGYFHNCFGTWTWANGDKYVGEWKDDKQHGPGTFTFAKGDKYVGEYKDGKRNGQFTVTYASGDKYVGEFKDDKRSGQGTYSHAGGTVKEGIWKDGEFQYAKKLSPPVPVAKTPTQDDEIISASDFPDCPNDENVRWHNCFGTYKYASGDKYVGEFKDDEFNGKGTYIYADGNKYVGEFKDDKFNGLFVVKIFGTISYLNAASI